MFLKELLTLIEERKNVEAQYYLFLHKDNLGDVQKMLLHHAAGLGNETMVEYLISNNHYEIDHQDANGGTPLMRAVTGKHEQAAQVLLEAGANMFHRDVFGKSVLDMVFDSRPVSLSMVKVFFHEKYMNKITKDMPKRELAEKLINGGMTLHIAVFLKNLELAKLLLKNGCSVNAVATNDGRETALHIAVYSQDVKMVKFLVNHGARLNALDRSEKSPLDCTNYFEEFTTNEAYEIFKYLFEKITARNNIFLNKPFFKSNNVIDKHMYLILENGNKQVLNFILQSNINMQATYIDGRGILHLLSKNKYFGDQDFRRTNFDVNLRDRKGYAALHYAAKYNVKAVQFLLDNKANVNAKDYKYQETPIYLSLYWRNVGEGDDSSIKLLLQSGAELQSQVWMGDRYITIFDAVFEPGPPSTLPVFLKPVIVHLAILKVQGIRINQLIWERIISYSEIKDLFDRSESSLQGMKSNVLGNSNVTLFEFVSEKDKKLDKYIRNEELVAELMKIIIDTKHDVLYLSELIESRLANAMRRREITQKAANNLCKIMGLQFQTHHIIVEHILDYLIFEDFKQLQKVCQSVM